MTPTILARGPRLGVVLALAAAGLVGCGRDEAAHVTAFCPNFSQASTNPGGSLAVADPQGVAAEECVHRWAFALASGDRSAGVVAEAAVAACEQKLAMWNEAALSQGGPAGEAMSVVSGAPTNPVSEHNNFIHSRALLYVEEARAGACAPPPVKNGLPAGT